ncbi:MAG: flippase-like domain-containing protein [Deltaproteobacteria bacterium]|jgi:uncharacterized protein (TIRG00374 family)|nr:flippase-like domain-containing protein [Deltaproteobacteria bacterium]
MSINGSRAVVFLGTGLGLSMLAWFLVNMDWRAFVSCLERIDGPALLPAAGFMLAGTLCRSLRWEILLRPSLPLKDRPGFGKRWRLCWLALCAGYFGNMIFPAKAGEFIRMFHIHKSLGLNMGAAVAMSALDRLLDVCCVLILGLILAFSVLADVPSLYVGLVPLALLVLAILAAGAAFFARQGAASRGLGRLRSRLPGFIADKALIFGQQISGALRNIASPSPILRGLALSACAFCLDVLFCWRLMLAFGWQLPLEAAMLMELSLCLAGILPSAPAYLGLYQAAAIFSLGWFGGAQADGMAYALLVQVLSVSLSGAIGAGGFFAMRKSARQA